MSKRSALQRHLTDAEAGLPHLKRVINEWAVNNAEDDEGREFDQRLVGECSSSNLLTILAARSRLNHEKQIEKQHVKPRSKVETDTSARYL
jgi:hypothetical protein